MVLLFKMAWAVPPGPSRATTETPNPNPVKVLLLMSRTRVPAEFAPFSTPHTAKQQDDGSDVVKVFPEIVPWTFAVSLTSTLRPWPVSTLIAELLNTLKRVTP